MRRLRSWLRRRARRDAETDTTSTCSSNLLLVTDLRERLQRFSLSRISFSVCSINRPGSCLAMTAFLLRNSRRFLDNFSVALDGGYAHLPFQIQIIADAENSFRVLLRLLFSAESLWCALRFVRDWKFDAIVSHVLILSRNQRVGRVIDPKVSQGIEKIHIGVCRTTRVLNKKPPLAVWGIGLWRSHVYDASDCGVF